ncbi:hypothetical protein LINPERHAP1_LOCUS20402 [Linum perenne]
MALDLPTASLRTTP